MLDRGETFFYTLKIRPDGDRRYFDGSYTGTVYFAYYDDIGTYDEMFSGNSISIRFDIYDKLPDIRIINVDAPLVDRSKEFDVDITIMNYGGSTASNLKVLLPYDSNQFQIVEGGEQELDDLASGEVATITFTMKAQEEISDGTTYSFTLFFSYSDVQGRTRTFGESQTDSFSIRIKDRIIPSQTQTVIKDDGQIISDGAGNLLLGIMIVIAVIVFVKLTSNTKVEVKNVQAPVEQKQEKAPRGKKIKEDVDEDEEEEDEDDEDEEDEEDDIIDDDEDWK